AVDRVDVPQQLPAQPARRAQERVHRGRAARAERLGTDGEGAPLAEVVSAAQRAPASSLPAQRMYAAIPSRSSLARWSKLGICGLFGRLRPGALAQRTIPLGSSAWMRAISRTEGPASSA